MFWPVFTETYLRIGREKLKHQETLKNATIFLKTNVFKSHNRHKIWTRKTDRLTCKP